MTDLADYTDLGRNSRKIHQREVPIVGAIAGDAIAGYMKRTRSVSVKADIRQNGTEICTRPRAFIFFLKAYPATPFEVLCVARVIFIARPIEQILVRASTIFFSYDLRESYLQKKRGKEIRMLR